MNISDFKLPLTFIIIGAILVILGALLKIQDWENGLFNGNTLLILGGISDCVGAVLVIYTLLKKSRNN